MPWILVICVGVRLCRIQVAGWHSGAVQEMPFAVAYRLNDTLYVGGEVIALFGHMRNRYTLGGSLFKYTLRGPGVQGMFGLTWKPYERWSLGLGVRTPGRIWMDGSTAVPAMVRRDVDLALEMPTQVSLGAPPL